MALHYDLNTDLKALDAVLDDYTGWFLQVTSRIFYPRNVPDSRGEPLACPPSFGAWNSNAEKTGAVPADMLRNMRNLHDDLCARSELLMENAAREKAPPPYDEFLKLTVLFEEFAGRLRRYEVDRMLDDSGIDSLTGLRSLHAMEKDIKREMERLARQGKAFAMALVRIDDFENIRNGMSKEELEKSVRIVSDLVKKCMRSFDDAYYGDNGMFILSLKQTGTPGGIKALKRLKKDTDALKMSYKNNGVETLLTLSSCIGEPGQNEDVMMFLENLKKDLDTYREDPGSVLEYFELSPLQRYIRDKDQNQG
ncbi:MAG: diguanylate cyclase [Alphaproteobacteria bacterium]